MASLDFEEEKGRFRTYYSENLPLLSDANKFFHNLVESLLAESESFERPTVSSRLKNREECIKKFGRKYQTALEKSKTEYEIKDYITDLIGVRVVCLYESDIKDIVHILSDSFDVMDVTDKISKVESSEDSFGYKGFHMDLAINEQRRALPECVRYEELRFEVQIRTIIQDGWSVLDHKIKYKKSIPTVLKRRINALAAIFELADHEFLSISNETTKLEEEGKDAIVTIPVLSPEDEYLDAFDFLKIAPSFFPGYGFLNYKVDGFVQEILGAIPQYTKANLLSDLEKGKDMIQKYSDYQEETYCNNLNPYTQIRHVLYLSNKTKFKFFLYNQQRHNFDDWLKENQ